MNLSCDAASETPADRSGSAGIPALRQRGALPSAAGKPTYPAAGHTSCTDASTSRPDGCPCGAASCACLISWRGSRVVPAAGVEHHLQDGHGRQEYHPHDPLAYHHLQVQLVAQIAKLEAKFFAVIAVTFGLGGEQITNQVLSRSYVA